MLTRLVALVLLLLVLQTSSKEDDICNHALTTDPIKDKSTMMSGYGILFTVSSPYTTATSQINQKEMIISSLGFYVLFPENSATKCPTLYVSIIISI